MISFEYPYLFLLFFLFIACEFLCKERKLSLYFPHHEMIKAPFDTLLLMRLLLALLLITALASPYTQKEHKKEHLGHSLALALDASGSMRGGAFEVVKSVVEDFVKKRKNDNIGLVVFGTNSYIASPLTFNNELLLKILKDLDHDTLLHRLDKSTALYDAFSQQIRLLKNSKAKSKVAVLLTDGVDNASKSDINKLIDIAVEEKIKVYAIGIGDQYNPRELDIIAKKTEGKSFQAYSKEGLEKIYTYIDEMEKSEIKSNVIISKEYYYLYPLAGAILLLLLYLYIRAKNAFSLS